MTLQLTDSLYVSSGNGRQLFIHPEDPTKCVKVQFQPAGYRISRLVPGKWIEIPPSNQREIKGYRDVRSRLKRNPHYMTNVYGLQETNLGMGLLVENAHADPGSTYFGLKEYINLEGGAKHRKDLTRVRDQYIEIVDEFQRNNIYNHCLRRESVVVVCSDGNVTIRLIDFKTRGCPRYLVQM